MARFKREAPPRYGKPQKATLLGAAATKSCGKVGEDQAIEVCLTKPKKPGPKVSNSTDVCRLLRTLRLRDREAFVTVSLATDSSVLGVEEVARGSVGGVDVHPREIFKAPILLGASGIILAHNHPSGSQVASQEDLELTRRMKKVGQDMGMPILDHVIVAGDSGCTSLMERGLMGARRRRRRRRRR